GHAVDECGSAAHGARRCVEREEEAVSDGVDLPAAENDELFPGRLLVRGKDRGPGTVADPLERPRRAHDVRDDERLDRAGARRCRPLDGVCRHDEKVPSPAATTVKLPLTTEAGSWDKTTTASLA